MKKLYFLTLIFPAIIFAQSYLISNIPLPKTYIQNLDPYPCDEECLQTYIDNDMIFSFLSYADSKLENQDQDDIRMMNISILNLGSAVITDKIRIALLLPYKVIGRYALSTTNATFAYLIAKNHSFELKSYKIESESVEDIQKALQKISNDGVNYVIAPLTQQGADAVAEINPQMNVFFPTINKKDVTDTSSYLVYGGIDYQAQSDLLLKEAISPLVIFYDSSSIGKKLSLYEENQFINAGVHNNLDTVEVQNKIIDTDKSVVKFSIPKRTTNLERQLSKNKNIVEGSFFINTPIVKTGMIMSQLTLYDTNATNVLSTQINYDPLVLSMTQYVDRKNMIIANSITHNNNILIEANSLLGNDIVYDWINYTTTVGIDYFFSLATREDREYNIVLLDNQMVYPIELLNPARYRFIKYISDHE
ncbi:MAG: SRSO17 transposase [Sulfurimonas sp.]|jgi:SRSO17 transposase